MNTKIMLKTQKLHIITTIGWAFILFLGILTRGLISDVLFWLLAITVIILFILDIIYFVIRVTEAHYLLITNHKIYLKRFFKSIEEVDAKDIISITYTNVRHGYDRILITTNDNELLIKEDYKIPKKNLLLTMKQISDLPKNIEITHKKSTT